MASSSPLSSMTDPVIFSNNLALSDALLERDVRWVLSNLETEATHFRIQTDSTLHRMKSETVGSGLGPRVGGLEMGSAVVETRTGRSFQPEHQVHEPPSSESAIPNQYQRKS